MNNSDNIFENAVTNVQNVFVFVASVALLIIGSWLFCEDVTSSMFGIQQLEKSYGIVATSYNATYLALSVLPQVFQVVLLYLIFADTKRVRKWRYSISVGACILIDVWFDLYYRSGQNPFESFPKLFVTLFLVLFAFTIGSEIAMSLGFGLSAALFRPFLLTMKSNFIGFDRIKDDLNKLGNQGQQKSRNKQNSSPKDNQARKKS